MSARERTVEDLGNFLEYHQVVDFHCIYTGGKWEVYWDRSTKHRLRSLDRISADSFLHAISKFMDTVIGDSYE